jgi:hypothetical protein
VLLLLLPHRSSGSHPPSSYTAPQQQAPPKKLTAAQRKQQAAAQAAAGSAAYPGVRTDGLAGLGLDEEAAAIQSETREQDKYLDEISRGLDQLKMGAQVRPAVLLLQLLLWIVALWLCVLARGACACRKAI